MNKIDEMARDLEDYACMSNFQSKIAAKTLHTLGYCKAEDVSKKIFAEAIATIGKIITKHIESDNSLIETEVDIVHALVDLKKKYMKGKGENDETVG